MINLKPMVNTMKSKPKKLGLFMLIALVCGNMIGSGVFLLPSSLAALGSISLWSWAVTGFGALILALLFAKMSILVPYSGGPFAYAYAAFGEFIGFQTVYTFFQTDYCLLVTITWQTSLINYPKKSLI